MIHPMYLFDNVDCLLQPSFPKMSNKNKRASKETAGSVGSKKKKQLQQSTLFSDGDEVLRGLNKAHIGKRLLFLQKSYILVAEFPLVKKILCSSILSVLLTRTTKH